MTTTQQSKPIITKNPTNPAARLIDLVCILVVIALVGLTFGRSLESFFIADDFGEVSYVHKIFNGQAHLFWSNFTGNYMQIPSMAVWRPWLLATLVFDYAIWKANAFGYYLTNILYYAGDAILLYALIRKLTAPWTPWRSHIASLFTAAIFAVNPLHCESVTWVVGRVDVACCFYYLLSFLLLLNNGRSQRLTATLATICFWLALWTKEMAIGLPVMVSAAWLILPNTLQPLEKLKQAVVKASPLWISTLIYFPLRYLFLGTLAGGYTGSIGASQFDGLIKRWLDPDTLHRIFYPLNYSLFQDHSIYGPILTALYFVAGAIVVARLFNRELSMMWTMFLLIWCATCAAPIYQLWGLGYNLEGSRFYYFLTLPLSFALPLLLFQPAGNRATSKAWTIWLSAASLACLTIAFGKIAYATNMTWVHAGKEAKAVLEQSKTMAAEAGQFTILGLPKRNSAAHMILNGETYRLMLRPPFTEENIADRFITFEPILFGPAEYTNAQRLKATVGNTKTFVWSSHEKQFMPLSFDNFDQSAATNLPIQLLATNALNNRWHPYHIGQQFNTNGDMISATDCKPGDGIRFSNLQINPLNYDYLVFDFQTKDNQPVEFKAAWGADGLASIATNGSSSQFQTVYMPLSHYWRWFTNKHVNELNLLLPTIADIRIRNVRLLPGSLIAPTLKLQSAVSDTTGVYNVETKDKLQFAVTNPGADKVAIEISKPNFFFENFSGLDQSAVVDKTIALAGNSFLLEGSYFDKPGYYQVRAVLPNGITSDSITIQRLP